LYTLYSFQIPVFVTQSNVLGECFIKNGMIHILTRRNTQYLNLLYLPGYPTKNLVAAFESIMNGYLPPAHTFDAEARRSIYDGIIPVSKFMTRSTYCTPGVGKLLLQTKSE